VTINQDIPGDIAQLAVALGLLDNQGQFDTGFFTDPTAQIAGVLRDATRLQALLDFLDQVLGDSAPPVSDANASWTPLVQLSENIALYLTTSASASGTVIGLGTRATTSSTPGGQATLAVPLLLVPPGAAAIVFLPGSSAPEAVATLTVQADLGSAELDAAGISLFIPLGTEQPADVGITVSGLTLPGSASPLDLSFGALHGAGPSEAELAQVITGLIQSQLASQSLPADVTALLGVFGLDPAAPIPLPLASVATQGLAAIENWLGSVARSPSALEHWLAQVGQLLGAAPPGASPSTISWPLGSDISLSLSVATAADAAAGLSIAPVLELVASFGGDPAFSLELSAGLLRATAGPRPSIAALPSLSCTAVYGGGASGLLNLTEDGTALAVNAVRAGVALDSARRLVLVLAAESVDIGPPGAQHHHDVLDLTSPDALAQIGTAALSSLTASMLTGLAPFGPGLRLLLGLDQPPHAPANWPSLNLPALFTDPVGAVAAYHAAIIALGAASYAALLGAIAALFGQPASPPGSGTAADPWVPFQVAGTELAVWAVGSVPATIHVGARCVASSGSLGGAFDPSVSFSLVIDALALTLPAPGAASPGTASFSALSSVTLGASLATPAATPLSTTIGDANLTLAGGSVGVSWSPATGLRSSVSIDGASIELNGVTTAVALPSLDTAGTLQLPPEITQTVTEALASAFLTSSGNPVAQTLPALLGLGGAAGNGPGGTAAAPASELADVAAPAPGGPAVPGFLDDPVDWIRVRLASELASDSQSLLQALVTSISALITGSAPTTPASALPASGTGTAEDPYLVQLPVSGTAELAAAVWADPAGPVIPGAAIAGLLQPGTLADWLSGTGAPMSTAQIAQLLTSASAIVPDLSGLLAGRDTVAAGWDALIARCAGGDGLLPGQAPDIAGATGSSVDGIPHALLPTGLNLTSLGTPTANVILYITGPYEPSWPDPSLTTIDLTPPGLAATAFDVSAVAGPPGPWHIRLPFRSDCPGTDAGSRCQAQADRLARVVSAAGGTGRQVLLVAHGSAGGAAQLVAASGVPVAGLVLLGVPAAAVSLDILDAPPAADALALLRALLPAPTSTPDAPDLALARSVIGFLGTLFNATADPNIEFSPPPGLATPTVPTWSIRGVLDANALTRAVGAVAQAALSGFSGAATTASPTAVRFGLSARQSWPAATSSADPTGISVDVTCRLEASGVPLADGAAVLPSLRIDAAVYRDGGWLAGGPQGSAPTPGVLRTPSLRRAMLTIWLGPGLASAKARITLTEGSALGTTAGNWALDATTPLTPAARVLLGRLASALSPVPASGPVSALTDLLAAAGLADAATTAPAFALSGDAVQQLLIDPAAQFGSAFSQLANRLAAADALRRLLGNTSGTGGVISIDTDGLTLSTDLSAASPTVTVSSQPGGFVLGAGLVLTGAASAGASGTVSGSVTLGPGLADGSPFTPSLALSFGSASTVALAFASPPAGIPARVLLRPAPATGQIPGLGSAVAETASAALLQLLLARLRSSLSEMLLARIDPVLNAAGLLSGSGQAARVVLPFGGFADPAGWARAALSASEELDPEKVSSLLDAVRGAFGLPAAAHGTLPLNSALLLQGMPDPSGQLELSLKCSTASSGASIEFTAGLALPAHGPPVATLAGAFGPAAGPGSLDVSLQAGQIGAVLTTQAASIPILPGCPGLGSLAADAQAALPFVLNALETHGPDPVATAVGAVRTTLALGTPGFDAAQLSAFATNPGTQLVNRLTQTGAGALASLFRPLLSGLPAPWAVTSGGTWLKIALGEQWVQVSLAGSPPVVTVEVSGTATIPGPSITLAVDATADTNGLRELVASAGIDPAHALALGPIGLAPLVQVDVGPQASPPEVAFGLAWPANGHQRSARIVLGLEPSLSAAFKTYTDSAADVSPDMAVLLTNMLAPAVANLALGEPAIRSLLATTVSIAAGTKTIQQLVTGVLLTSASTPAFDPAVLELTDLPGRLATLLGNLSGAEATVADNLTVGVSGPGSGGASLVGLSISVAPGERAELVSADLSLAVEAADDWVDQPKLGPAGLSVLFFSKTGPVAPVIVVEGLGIRLYRPDNPLIDAGLQIGSIALYGLLKVGNGITDGGVAIEFADLAAPVASASGDGNSVAQGILGDPGQSGAGGDTTPLRPAFSPTLAVQRRAGSSGVLWSLSAGDGGGPWIINVDQSFGPLRVDDIGFAVTMGENASNDPVISSIAVSISGGVALLGLQLDLLDLSVAAAWPGQPLTQPTAWTIGLSGLDVSYSGAGVSLAGGLRRRDNPSQATDPPDYVGMLAASIGPYALSAFAGYGQFPSPSGKFTSLFVFAAINAPIGGVPAFFVTGLGGGAGINRSLVLPTSLSDFSTFPLVAALDPDSGLTANPAQAMDLMSSSFPPERGTFWFAAGVAFTSFALIDAVAVLSVEVGDGTMVTLLGLATAALPTPEFPLAQIQLALMATFSTAEGVLLVQAQLTDQSYILDPACRLTGGFAYASWFGSNPNAGQFVVTVGGYHPSFQHAGYPAVPRVGYVWDIGGCLTISGQSYFALTSDAIMAGTSFTASLTAGPVWATLALGVDAIMYFDPFQFSVHGYASIAAGITISVDLLFCTISETLSFHLGADVLVEGPSIHGSAVIHLDVTSVTISFGSTNDGTTTTLGWDSFRTKYLTAGDTKAVLAAAPGTGVIISGATGSAPPDGSPGNPWLLLPEFSLAVTTAAAATRAALTAAGAPFPPAAGSSGSVSFAVGGVIAIAPMGIAGIDSVLGLELSSANSVPTPVFTSTPGPGVSVTLTTGAMPKGVWAPQLASGQIPTGDTVAAGTGFVLTSRAVVSAGTAEISFNQVDVEPAATKTLPFGLEIAARPVFAPDAANADTFAATAPTSAGAAIDQAQQYLSSGPAGAAQDALTAATFTRDRVAPPRLGLVTERTAPADTSPPTLTPIMVQPPPPVDTTVHAPVITALLTSGPSPSIRPVLRTTAATAPAGTRVAAPSLAAVTASSDPAYAWPLVYSSPNPVAEGSVAGAPAGANAPAAGLQVADGGAASGRAGAATEVSQSAITDPSTTAVLSALGTGLLGSGVILRPGELLVTTLPNHEHDFVATAVRPSLSVAGDAAVRFTALSGTGTVLADSTLAAGTFTVPQMTARLAIWCVGGSGGTPAGLYGWAATDRLPYIGCGVSLGAGAVVSGLQAPDRGYRGAQAAVIPVSAAAASAGAVWTTLPPATTVVVVSLDAADKADLSTLALGLSGAVRTADANGSELPPTLVTAGGRGHLLFAVSPDPTAPPSSVVVSVATGTGWRLAGVLGGTSDVATIAARIAASGTADCVAPLIQEPTGSATVAWVPASPPPATSPNTASAAAESPPRGTEASTS
jgi:large repetitive protein